ncbi:MAG: DNA recombination protein RmuC [Thermoanaerobaculum sp.]|nr:DNA recombination protein RmuC [Thermoanaerobaculum sp.]
MSEIWWLGLALAALAGLVVVAWSWQARAVRRVEEQLQRVLTEVASAYQNALAPALSQVGQTVERFHLAMGEFGQRVQQAQQQELEAARQTLSRQLAELIAAVNQQLTQVQAQVGERFEGATRVFGELKGQLGQVAEMAARMERLGQEIQELQDILKAPKLRGQLGELQLEAFLAQLLPEQFWQSQYRFQDGQVVDAVIFLRQYLVPVDAKFPLEAFQRLLRAEDEQARRQARREFVRTVKGRVDEIASKYIRPAEGTFDFALMFVPSENVYYEILLRGEGDGEEPLLSYATARKVIPVSPHSFYAYLMTIVLGLKGMQVEARAAQILQELSRLQGDFEKLTETLRVLGRHLSNALNQFHEADRLAGRFADRLDQAASGQLPGESPSSLPTGKG